MTSGSSAARATNASSTVVFSDARLTGEEYELALAGARAREARLEGCHHAVTSHEPDFVRDRRPPRRARPRGDEAIPAARDGLDEARLIGVILQGAANLEDDHPQHAV
jgi:hypothetical protein